MEWAHPHRSTAGRCPANARLPGQINDVGVFFVVGSDRLPVRTGSSATHDGAVPAMAAERQSRATRGRRCCRSATGTGRDLGPRAAAPPLPIRTGRVQCELVLAPATRRLSRDSVRSSHPCRFHRSPCPGGSRVGRWLLPAPDSCPRHTRRCRIGRAIRGNGGSIQANTRACQGGVHCPSGQTA